MSKTIIKLALPAIILGLASAYYFHHGTTQFPRSPRTATVLAWPAQSTVVAGVLHAGQQDGAAAQASFSDPFGLTLASDGSLYVADAGDNNRIRKISAQGVVTSFAGSQEGFADGQGSAAMFNTPSGLAMDLAGNIYVADTGNHAIRKISPAGVVTTLAGNGKAGYRDGLGRAAQFNAPIGVAVGSNGTVYVADTYNDRIRKITPQGQVSTLAGGAQPGFADGLGEQARFDTPCAVTVDDSGNLYIADTKNNAIRIVHADGQVSTIAQSDPADKQALLRRPLSLARSVDGVLYVGEMYNGQILQIAQDGHIVALPSGTASDAPTLSFTQPSAIVLNPNGGLFVSDALRYQIAQVSMTNALTSVAVNLPEPQAHGALLWPVAPQQRRHEIVGTVGEVRGDSKGEERDHFHAGVDVQANMGTAVLAVQAEKIQDPLANWGYGGLSEGMALQHFHYIHMRVGRDIKDQAINPEKFSLLTDETGQTKRVRVRRGTRFAQGEALGTINRMYHVHLEYADLGEQWNPLLLNFLEFTDTIAPHIEQIEILKGNGQALKPLRDGHVAIKGSDGDLRIVAEAYDQINGNQSRRRLGVYQIGYQILRENGETLNGFAQPLYNQKYNRLPENREDIKIAYAEGSGITAHGAEETRFLYEVTNTVRDGVAQTGSWKTTSLAPGNYVLRIVARDYSGNQTQRDVAISYQQ